MNRKMLDAPESLAQQFADVVAAVFSGSFIYVRVDRFVFVSVKYSGDTCVMVVYTQYIGEGCIVRFRRGDDVRCHGRTERLYGGSDEYYFLIKTTSSFEIFFFDSCFNTILYRIVYSDLFRKEI